MGELWNSLALDQHGRLLNYVVSPRISIDLEVSFESRFLFMNSDIIPGHPAGSPCHPPLGERSAYMEAGG